MNYSLKDPKNTHPTRLGEILLLHGSVRQNDLDHALTLQKNREARLGDILVAHKYSTPNAVDAALRAQISGESLDITASPPDPAVLKGLDPKACIRLQALPWRKVGATLLIAAADHTKEKDIAAHFPGRIRLIQADRVDIYHHIEHHFSTELAEAAATLCPPRFSCRTLTLAPQRTLSATVIGLILGLALAAPDYTLVMLLLWALVSNFATTVLRLSALIAFLKPRPATPDTGCLSHISDHRKHPRVSILIPLFREDKVIPALLSALGRLTYPKELLDIKILLEENDTTTQDALKKENIPHWAEVLVVPADKLQTKPRAMNYALPFCTGSIIGIYDAEDRPDPDQIDKVVAHLLAAPPDIAAVQANLDYYNTQDNWLSRCFTIEYAAWFRVIMQGMQRLGLPLPLGGTSVFIRRRVLERIGGWDAHNVTEDADLGMRLARFGYRCDMVDSTTWEEANKVPVGWIKQRSRWIKGFMITWLSQMRQPIKLKNDLGWIGFLSLQTVLLGTATAYLLAPVFWLMWLGLFGAEWAFLSLLPDWFWKFAFPVLLIGEAVMAVISVIAVSRKRTFSLLPFILTMPLYWPIGTLAAYKALYEVIVAPFYWDKTTHGLD
ncbi:MAG: glycosyltransferase [Rhodobacteraceae bacterium]|nr:glycosyltransferase [Paracoccaceae bacterium]